MANSYYSLRSYDHFCFFCQINNSKKKKDEFAFFVFFTFKGWKRLVVADGPRQVINAFTLYAFADRVGFSSNLSDYYEGNYFTAIMLLAMMFTVLVFAASFLMLTIAAIMYIPLIIYIKGNLKAFCCHKIDKRISELVRYKKKMRLAKQAAIARAEAKGDFNHLKNKKGEIVGMKIPQPTLPTVDVEIYNHHKDNGSVKKRNSTESYGGEKLGGGFESPGFGPNRFMGNTGNGNGSIYGRESPSLLYNGIENGEEYASNANLMANAGPAGNIYDFSATSSQNHNTSPSIPQSSHTSPESYPNHVRGINGQPSSVIRNYGSNSNLNEQLIDSLGPIGTSPMVRPMQVRGYQHQMQGQAQTATQGKSPLGMNVQNSTSNLNLNEGFEKRGNQAYGNEGYGKEFEYGNEGSYQDYGNDFSEGGYYYSGNQYDYSYGDQTGSGYGNQDLSNYVPFNNQDSLSHDYSNQISNSFQPQTDSSNLTPNSHQNSRSHSTRSENQPTSFGLSDVIDDYYGEGGAGSMNTSRNVSRNENYQQGGDQEYNYTWNQAATGGGVGGGSGGEESPYDEIESPAGYGWGERNEPVNYQFGEKNLNPPIKNHGSGSRNQTWDDPRPESKGFELVDNSAGVKETTVRGARKR